MAEAHDSFGGSWLMTVGPFQEVYRASLSTADHDHRRVP